MPIQLFINLINLDLINKLINNALRSELPQRSIEGSSQKV